MRIEFKRTRQLLEEGLASGLQIGGQVYVSREGEPLLDHAFGEARRGAAMTPDTLMLWFSSGKPVTAIAIAQLSERKELGLRQRVVDFIPEFGQKGKEEITIWHLLTHTSGIRLADRLQSSLGWEEMIGRICETALEPDWPVGAKGGYSTGAGWYILGELVRRVTGTDLDEYARARIFGAASMNDSWLRLPLDAQAAYGDRIGLMHNTAGAEPLPIALQNAEGLARLRPGSSARGPVRELGLFYEALLGFGSDRLVSEDTLNLFTNRQREGLYDYTFMHTIDFGLGLIINSNRYGAETVPYGYGRLAGERSFGHSGAESSCAFADPENGIVVAWVMNGMPGDRAHQKRARELNTAIYGDLGG